MRLSTINGKDWQTFAERFPSAEAFLLGASLRGELRELERGVARAAETAARYGRDDPEWTPTRAARLRELREWARVDAGAGA